MENEKIREIKNKAEMYYREMMKEMEGREMSETSYLIYDTDEKEIRFFRLGSHENLTSWNGKKIICTVDGWAVRDVENRNDYLPYGDGEKNREKHENCSSFNDDVCVDCADSAATLFSEQIFTDGEQDSEKLIWADSEISAEEIANGGRLELRKRRV